MGVALTERENELVAVAERLVRDRGDFERHSVAAAGRTHDGQVLSALNVYHFTGGPCAELVLLGVVAATSSSGLEIVVAVADEGRGVLAPCGRCRQVLFDYYPDLRVVVSTGRGLEVVPIATLLPWANSWTADTGSQPFAAGA